MIIKTDLIHGTEVVEYARMDGYGIDHTPSAGMNYSGVVGGFMAPRTTTGHS